MGLQQLRSRLPSAVIPWLAACVLLSIGVVSAAVTVANVPDAELARANDAAQHLTIDPTTGIVSGLIKKEEPAPELPAEAAPPAAEAAPATAPSEEPAKPEEAATQTQAEEPAPTTAEPAPAEAAAATAPVAHDVNSADQLTPNPENAPKLNTAAAITQVPAIAKSNESLVAPPAKEITEEKNGLLLPKIAEGGASPASLYAKNFTAKPNMARVSIVVTDAGYNPQSIAMILKLPRSVTVAVSPYAPDAAQNIALLHIAGYETWGMLPMMGAHYPSNDPGPLGLIASLPPEELSRRLQTTMATTIGAVGFVLPADESLSENAKIFPPTLSAITARGLRILSTHPSHTVEKLAGKNKDALLSIARADVVLDANASTAEIQSKLDGLQALLLKQPSLILVVPARPNILTLLTEWLNANGLGATAQIAPLSAMYKAAEPAAAEVVEEKHGADPHKKPDLEKPSGPKPKYNQDPSKINEINH